MPTQYRTPTRFEMYQQAIEQLTQAVDALDQAHASMKDAQVADVASTGHYPLVIKSVIFHAEQILEQLKTAECLECGHALSKHGDKYGCEYDRGDVEMTCRDGGTILAAAGPCGCEWGQQRD